MKTLYRTLLILLFTALFTAATYAIGTSEWSEEYTANSIPVRGRFSGGGGGGGGGHNHFSEEPSPEFALSGSLDTLLPMTMTMLVVLIIQKIYKQTQDTQKARRKLKEKL